MAPAHRSPPQYLTLLREPHRFDFFQALRLLECLAEERPRIGEARHPTEEPVRLGQEVLLGFAPASLASCELRPPRRVPHLAVYFLGLFGPNGPLPLHFAEHAERQRQSHGDETLPRFLDIFHHRMLAMFYRAWANAQPTVERDRPQADRFERFLGSLFGLGRPALRHRDAMPDITKLHFAGHLSCQTRHPDGLRDVLTSFFGFEVRIEEFVGQWIDIPPENRCYLGRSPDTGIPGRTLTVGARVWERQHKFRIVVGPMDFESYERMLPGGTSLEQFAAIVRNYAGLELDWEVSLILAKDSVPRSELGDPDRPPSAKGDDELAVRPRLGWTSWLKESPLEKDAAGLSLSAAASGSP